MLSFSTLEHMSREQLILAFNRAFADYSVPVRLNMPGLSQKMTLENLKLSFSVGVFDGPKLVGLMLHGLGEWMGRTAAYNGGTGIWPEYRGQGLVGRMYEHLQPVLAHSGARSVILEVIDTNERAIHAYQRVGFRPARQLDCFKGTLNYPQPKSPPDITVHHHNRLPWEELPRFWAFLPTWQHSLDAARRGLDFLDYLSLTREGQLLAYGVLQRRTGRVIQFGVHPSWRSQGLGRLLFFHLSRLGNPLLTVLNVDHSDQATRAFLRKAGLERYLGQWEMVWEMEPLTNK